MLHGYVMRKGNVNSVNVNRARFPGETSIFGKYNGSLTKSLSSVQIEGENLEENNFGKAENRCRKPEDKFRSGL